MVCKYLNIARKEKTVNSLTPVIENGDTLAYVAQYANNQGWDLISGDRRIAPILAFAETGTVDMTDTISPGVNALRGMLYMVYDIKSSNETTKHEVWEKLEPKTYNRIMPRDTGTGMWIALDTVSEKEVYAPQRLIKTKWGQAEPWNIYTPYKNGKHCLVGCAAVAVAQYIYYYRENNHAGYTLPTTVSYENIINSTPFFSNFSESGWIGMACDSTDANTDKAAMFMSYLGKQMLLSYDINNTSGHVFYARHALDIYNINRIDKYNFDGPAIENSILNGNPVFIAASTENQGGHMFIIDGCLKRIERTYASFFWDPGYKYTQDDIIKYEPWRFEENIHLADEKGEYMERNLYYDEQINIAMNWGWNGRNDNYYYILGRRSNPDSNFNYYAPNWSAQGFRFNIIDFISYDGYAE